MVAKSPGARTRLEREAPGVVEPKPSAVKMPSDQQRAEELVTELRKKYRRRYL
jgi:hypothetical protein